MAQSAQSSARQRRLRRVDLRKPVHAQVWIDDGSETGEAPFLLSNLSENGAFIRVSKLKVGSIVSLRFRLLGSDEDVSCSAVVRHTGQGVGLGVEFLDRA